VIDQIPCSQWKTFVREALAIPESYISGIESDYPHNSREQKLKTILYWHKHEGMFKTIVNFISC